jgi:hypothetical protein
MAGFCEYDNESSDSTKGGEFILMNFREHLHCVVNI